MAKQVANMTIDSTILANFDQLALDLGLSRSGLVEGLMVKTLLEDLGRPLDEDLRAKSLRLKIEKLKTKDKMWAS